MNIHKASILLLLIFLISACAPQTLPAATSTPMPTSTVVPTATALPTPTTTPVPTLTSTPAVGYPILADTFDDNGNAWILADAIQIKNGLMSIDTKGVQLRAIRIPIASTPADLMFQVDIYPGQTSDLSEPFIYGVGCRVNSDGTDFYFLGLVPVPDQPTSFVVAYFQIKDGNQIDAQMDAVELPRSEEGNGFKATVVCEGDRFKVLGTENTIVEFVNNDFQTGSAILGIYQQDGLQGNASFDNLVVSELP